MDLKNILKAIKFNEGTISMLLGAVVLVVVGILVINYFRGLRTGAPSVGQTTQTTSVSTPPTEHIVAKGEHLWGIAEKYYGSGYNWVDIAKTNSLTNPNRLLVGQTLNIPKAEPKIVPAASGQIISGQAISGASYTVIKGDNLWGIAVRAYGDGYQWVKVARENKLANPDLIYPGTVLTLSR